MMTTANSRSRETLAIDIETYSPVKLEDAGVYPYAAHPDFEILLFGCHWHGKTAVFDFAAGETLPDDIRQALTDPGVIKTAWNANFERVCLSEWYGVPMPPEQWACSMVRAAEAGLPRSLKAAGARLGLDSSETKDSAGAALIRFFCLPCKPTKKNGGRTRNMPGDDPEKWSRFKEYNRQDVVAEQAILQKLPAIIPREQSLWEADQAINDRGVMIDRPFVAGAIATDNKRRSILTDEAKLLTGLENPNSRAQMLRWINSRTGRQLETLRKEDLPPLLESDIPGDVRRVLEIRQELGKTSNSKYTAMAQAAGRDDRVRGITAFYGAPRTGRWSGRLVQLQNLPRNYLEDLDSPRQLIRDGHGDMLELMYDNPADTLSQLIRTALVPRAGYRFLVADFSAIEARVLAWVAGETWRLETFQAGGGIYEASASRMFGVPVERIKKGNPEYSLRQKGKIAELALGYQGAAGALIQMGALDMGLTEDELPALVMQWRDANQHITAMWKRIEKTALHVVKTGASVAITITGQARLTFECETLERSKNMRIVLPSGRSLVYRNAKVIPHTMFSGHEQLTYSGTEPTTPTVYTYGGKLTENIIQAIARDCLAEAILALEAAGFAIVFHVHDEVIVEEPETGASPDDIVAIMDRPLTWAPGLPLTADAYACRYYKKD